MKAKTRAEKLRIKRGRGRPRIEVVYREPNGRASRSAEAPAKLATEARARILNLSVKDARDPLCGSFIGYLQMLGPRDGLSVSQYDAAIRFTIIRNDWLKSKQAPGAIYDGTGRGIDETDPEAMERYERWCASVNVAYERARHAIMEAQMENRSENLFAALDYCIIQSQFHPHMIGATRLVCNALVRHFGTG